MRFQAKKKIEVAIAVVLIVALNSCGPSSTPIVYGQDGCEYCMMTIIDKKFAAEWVSETGKIFKFDDVECLIDMKDKEKLTGTAFVNDYTGSKELVSADDLLFVQAETLKSPMGANVAAFTDKSEMEKVLNEQKGRQLSWEEVQTNLKK